MLTIQRGHLMLPGQKSRHQGKEEESKLGDEIGKSCSAQFSFFCVPFHPICTWLSGLQYLARLCAATGELHTLVKTRSAAERNEKDRVVSFHQETFLLAKHFKVQTKLLILYKAA